MPLTNDIVEQAATRYSREFDRYKKLAGLVADECHRLLEDNVIRGSVQWRAKSPERLRLKLQKQMATGDHASEYTDADSVFRVIKDLAGARITAYVESDRKSIVDLVQRRFAGFDPDGLVVAEVKDRAGQYYRATHCMVRVKDDELIGDYKNLSGLGCELQVCSLLAHVYNEIEHDLRYKPLAGKLTKHEEGLLNILGKLMETGDNIVVETLDAVEARQRQNTAAFEDEYDFVARMRESFPAATNFTTNAGQLYEACSRLGLDTVEKIKQALNWGENTAKEGADLAAKLAEVVNKMDLQLKIDPLSSDQLLVLVLGVKGFAEKLRGFYPSGYGIGRPPRFLSVAKQLELNASAPASD